MILRLESLVLIDVLKEGLSKNLKVAFFGQPGAGKSSLINKLVGSDVTSSSPRTDETREAQIIEWRGLFLVDLPGYGTSVFPSHVFEERFDIYEFDLYICVFSGKFSSADSEFFRELRNKQKICILVRNKQDDLWQQGKSIEQIEEEICQDVNAQLGGDNEIFFTSCRSSYGIAGLLIAINAVLDDCMKTRWCNSAKILSSKFIKEKKDGFYRKSIDYLFSNDYPEEVFTRIRSSFGLDFSYVLDFLIEEPDVKEYVKEFISVSNISDKIAKLINDEGLNDILAYILPIPWPMMSSLVSRTIKDRYKSAIFKAKNEYFNVCSDFATFILYRMLINAYDRSIYIIKAT